MKYLLFALALLAACTSPIPENENSNETQNEKTMTAPVPFLVRQMEAALGEGAVWNDQNQQLYFIDIEGKKFHRLDPKKREMHSHDVGHRIGTVVPEGTDKAIVALQNGIFRLDLATDEMTLVAEPDKDHENIRMNDGKCDPAGRFWVGSMHLEQITGAASLYRIDHDGTWEKMIDSVTISNGIVWSLDAKKMYYIDTPTGQVVGYDFDLKTGAISNGKPVITIPEEMGYPDGMTIDAEGMVWIALWNGNAVTRWNPETGELLQTIKIPAHNVSSCAFGGKDLDTLYITSARVDMTEEELAAMPLSGSVFGVEIPGVKGVPAFHFGKN